MITFLIAVAALGVALYALKKLNDNSNSSAKKSCCKKENKE